MLMYPAELDGNVSIIHVEVERILKRPSEHQHVELMVSEIGRYPYGRQITLMQCQCNVNKNSK